MILLYIYMYIKTCGWNVAIIRTGMRSTYAANAGRAYAWSVYVDPLPVCREGYQSQLGRILWRKLTCLFVFICLFFAGVVFGLSSVYVQGGNRISTMFSALTVRNIMPGVPSGCFTGSFWYGGIQCTVFHFYRHSYCRGTRCLIFLSELMGPALSDLSLLLSRRLRTFGLYGYVAASFCREGSSRIAGRIYSIIFLLKYIKHPVFQNNSILYFVFLLNCTFDVSVCFCWSDRSISFSLSGLWRSDWCYSKMSYEHAVRHMYRFKGWPLPALLQRKGLQNTETGLNTSFLSFFICEETGEKCIPCRPDSVW